MLRLPHSRESLLQSSGRGSNRRLEIRPALHEAPSPYWFDALRFVRQAEQARQEDTLADLEHALKLYTGSYLPGIDTIDSVAQPRRRLQRLQRELRYRLIELLMYATRDTLGPAFRDAPGDSRLARWLMAMLIALEQDGEAEDIYRAHHRQRAGVVAPMITALRQCVRRSGNLPDLQEDGVQPELVRDVANLLRR